MIWQYFVRYNIDTGGVKSATVERQWNSTPQNSVLKNRAKLLGLLHNFRKLSPLPKCFNNFTSYCSLQYRKSSGFALPDSYCHAIDKPEECPVYVLTKELFWHRVHYRIAKIIVECAKRLLLEDLVGYKNGNINDIVESHVVTHKSKKQDYKVSATKEFLHRFKGVKGYGDPPKAVVWLLSDLSSPIHGINHWTEIDIHQLTPVHTHVLRLADRFGFLNNVQTSNEAISRRLSELYPEEPRKLDFALYRLGAELEENICRKIPDCESCRSKLPRIYNACPWRGAGDQKTLTGKLCDYS